MKKNLGTIAFVGGAVVAFVAIQFVSNRYSNDQQKDVAVQPPVTVDSSWMNPMESTGDVRIPASERKTVFKDVRVPKNRLNQWQRNNILMAQNSKPVKGLRFIPENFVYKMEGSVAFIDRFSMNLPGVGIVHLQKSDSQIVGKNQFVWIGKSFAHRKSNVTLSYYDGILSGSIEIDGRNFEISYGERNYYYLSIVDGRQRQIGANDTKSAGYF